METLVHIVTDAVWVFVIVLAFAVIGIIATIRWIIGLVTGAERAVETGVHNVEDAITHRGE